MKIKIECDNLRKDGLAQKFEETYLVETEKNTATTRMQSVENLSYLDLNLTHRYRVQVSFTICDIYSVSRN